MLDHAACLVCRNPALDQLAQHGERDLQGRVGRRSAAQRRDLLRRDTAAHRFRRGDDLTVGWLDNPGRGAAQQGAGVPQLSRQPLYRGNDLGRGPPLSHALQRLRLQRAERDGVAAGRLQHR